MAPICISSKLFHTVFPKEVSQEQKLLPFKPYSPLTHTRVKINKGIWYSNSQIVHLLNLQREIFPWFVCAAKRQLGLTPRALGTLPANMWGIHCTHLSASSMACFPTTLGSVYECPEWCWATPASQQVTCHGPSIHAALARYAQPPWGIASLPHVHPRRCKSM